MFSSVALWLRYLFGQEMTQPVRCPRRCGHISFTDGENLYVWGGHCKTGTNSMDLLVDEVWIFHNKFDSWSVKKCSGDIPKGTSGACCGIVYPHLYVLCGHCTHIGHSSTVKRLNLTTFVWETVAVKGPLISPRDKASSWVYRDKLYCFGGYGPDPQLTGLHHPGQGDFASEEWNLYSVGWNNQLLVFDPSTNEWSSPKFQNPRSVPLPRAAQATVLIKDKAFVFGGRHMQHRMNDLHCLDLTNLRWSGQIQPKGPVPEGRSWHTLSRLDDDRFFLFGGFSQFENVLNDAWIYTVTEQRWTQVIDHSQFCRGWHTAVVTNSQDVLVFGGFVRNILADDFDIEDISDTVVRFQLQPYSLKELSLQSVYSQVTPESWALLPKHLQEWLRYKRRLQADWLSLPHDTWAGLGPHVVRGFQTLTGDHAV